jgi:transposase
MMGTSKTIHHHRDGILRWFTSKVNNGTLEATNGLIQTAKRQAQGYRLTKNLKAMIFLLQKDLD